MIDWITNHTDALLFFSTCISLGIGYYFGREVGYSEGLEDGYRDGRLNK